MSGPKQKTMLIVEDDETLCARMAMAMEKRDFEVRTASSVAGGLDAIADSVPEFALVDLRLLDGNGLDVIKALEQADPAARAVILTGYGDIPTAVAAARIGAIDYLSKPASADEIVDVLLTPVNQTTPAPENPKTPEDMRFEHIEAVFHNAGENVSLAARLLSMHRRTLQRILKRHGVSADAAR